MAIDPEPEMLGVAEAIARERAIANVRFLGLRAEDVPPSLAPFRLVTFGNSFHWTDRVQVARALFPLVAPGGGLVILASSTAFVGAEPWKAVALDAIGAWLGPEASRRVGAGRLPNAPTHRDVLVETPFGEPRVRDIVMRHTWTMEALTGLLHSSSLQVRGVLGDRVDEFERDLRDRLMRAVPDGRFVDDITFTITAARRELE